MSPNAYAVYKKSLLCLLLGICVKKLNFLSCKHDPLVTAWCYLDAFFFFFFGSKSVCLNLTLSINVTYYFKTVISGHWPSVGWLFLLFCCLFFLITLKHLSASCMSQEMSTLYLCGCWGTEMVSNISSYLRQAGKQKQREGCLSQHENLRSDESWIWAVTAASLCKSSCSFCPHSDPQLLRNRQHFSERKTFKS